MNRSPVLPAILALCLGSCGPFQPTAIVGTGPPRAEHDAAPLHVEWQSAVVAGEDRPWLEVTVSAEPFTTRLDSVRVLTDDGRCLGESGPGDAVRCDVDPIQPTLLTVVAEAADGSSRSWRLRVTTRVVRWRETPDVTESPSVVAAWTYPLWGLPRDLADAPFTGLNRLGLGTGIRYAIAGNEPTVEREPVTPHLFATAGTVAGIALGFAWGAGIADPHFFQVLFYADAGAFAGGAAGAAAGLVSESLLGLVLPPIQTALLRSGVDRDPWKGTPPEVVVEAGRWTEDAIRTYERFDRGLCYFPNWRYVVRGTRYVLPQHPDGRDIGVAIEGVEVVDAG